MRRSRTYPARRTRRGIGGTPLDGEQVLHRVMRTVGSEAIQDPWANVGEGIGTTTLSPSYSPFRFQQLTEQNAILRQCIDAYIVNIESHGHGLVYVGPADQEDSDGAQREKEAIENFLSQPNGEYSITELRQRVRRDLETTGYAYMEVVRGLDRKVAAVYHLPCGTVRMTKRSSEQVPVTRVLPRGGRKVRVTVNCTFRKFVQRVGARSVYFKEFGDPRVMNSADGSYANGVELGSIASEVIHLSLWSGTDPYGLPRWIGQLPAVLGTREAELVNMGFFRDNAIPALAVMVGGGSLTEESIEAIDEKFNQHRGRASHQKILILEADADPAAASETGHIPAPKIDLKPLNQDRQKDGVFESYETLNYKKIRSAFRLPPIFIGLCHDADTEYLTRQGWKSFEDVADDDLLATLNCSTGAIEYQGHTQRHEYEYDGELLHIKNRGLDCLVTPNHRMRSRVWTATDRPNRSWQELEAWELPSVRGTIGGRCELPVAGTFVADDIDSVTVPGNVRKNARVPGSPSKNPKRDAKRDLATAEKQKDRRFVADGFLSLIGYFVSEGHAYENGYVSLSQNAGDIADDIYNCVKELGLNSYNFAARDSERGLGFCDGGVAGYLRKHCGSKSNEKKLPDFVFGLSGRQAEILLDALVNGDGSIDCRGRDGSFSYTTTSSVLANQLQAFGVQYGYRVVLSKVRQDNPKWNDYYRLSFSNIKTHTVDVRNQIKPVPYSGPVHCFSVPNDTLVTRRNGRVVISHNSEEFTYATARASLSMTEAQVFQPERTKVDEIFNLKLLAGDEGPPEYWAFRSNPPRVVDSEEVLNAIEKFNDAGAMTPNAAIELLNATFGYQLEPIAEEWGNLPWPATLALIESGQLVFEELRPLLVASLNQDEPPNASASD